MVEKNVNGDMPLNARINIKYNKDKPKISFSYPDKKTQARGSMFFSIQIIILIVGLLIYFFFMLSGEGNPNSLFYDPPTLEKYARCAAMHPLEILSSKNVCDAILREGVIDRNVWLVLFVVIFSFYILPAILYFPLRKKWDRLYPKYQAWGVDKKIAIFKAKDVREENGKIFCELPVFKNIVLDFKCKGEFSDYLSEIDIREHKFVYFRKKRITLKNGKKKRVHKANEWIWYARFYFTQRPRKGELYVLFK